MVSDFSKFDRPPLLHLGFAALDAFQVETGRLPRAWDEADAAKLLELAGALNDAAPASEASRKVADLDLVRGIGASCKVSGVSARPQL